MEERFYLDYRAGDLYTLRSLIITLVLMISLPTKMFQSILNKDTNYETTLVKLTNKFNYNYLLYI